MLSWLSQHQRPRRSQRGTRRRHFPRERMGRRTRAAARTKGTRTILRCRREHHHHHQMKRTPTRARTVMGSSCLQARHHPSQRRQGPSSLALRGDSAITLILAEDPIQDSARPTARTGNILSLLSTACAAISTLADPLDHRPTLPSAREATTPSRRGRHLRRGTSTTRSRSATTALGSPSRHSGRDRQRLRALCPYRHRLGSRQVRPCPQACLLLRPRRRRRRRSLLRPSCETSRRRQPRLSQPTCDASSKHRQRQSAPPGFSS